MRRVSKKRASEQRVYAIKRVNFLFEHGSCEAGDCTARSRDVHHTKGRLNGNYLDETTWLAVCRACHDRIHRNPSWARKAGLLA